MVCCQLNKTFNFYCKNVDLITCMWGRIIIIILQFVISKNHYWPQIDSHIQIRPWSHDTNISEHGRNVGWGGCLLDPWPSQDVRISEGWVRRKTKLHLFRDPPFHLHRNPVYARVVSTKWFVDCSWVFKNEF